MAAACSSRGPSVTNSTSTHEYLPFTYRLAPRPMTAANGRWRVIAERARVREIVHRGGRRRGTRPGIIRPRGGLRIRGSDLVVEQFLDRGRRADIVLAHIDVVIVVVVGLHHEMLALHGLAVELVQHFLRRRFVTGADVPGGRKETCRYHTQFPSNSQILFQNDTRQNSFYDDYTSCWRTFGKMW